MGAVGAKYKPVGIEIATLLNIPDRSPRLWLTLISEVVVSIVVLLLLYWDIRDYTARRIFYRSDGPKNPSNYVVLVMDIPSNERTEEKIFEKFNRIFPGQVIAAHLVRNASQLLMLKTRLISALNRQRRLCSQQGNNDNDNAIPVAEDQLQPDPIDVSPLTLSFCVDNHAISWKSNLVNASFMHAPVISASENQNIFNINSNENVSPTNSFRSASICTVSYTHLTLPTILLV